MSTKLAKQTQKTVGIGNGLRTATVASVSQAGVMLNINGAVVGPFACTAAMMPVVGSSVSVFRQDSTWIILGHAMPVPPQIITGITAAVTGATGTSGILNYPVPYPPSVQLAGFANILNGTSATRQWACRWLNTSNSQYEIVFNNASAAPVATTLGVTLIVFPVA